MQRRGQLSAAGMRVAFVGGGKMAEAMLAGWLAADRGPVAAWDASSFIVANPGEARRAYLEQTYGVACVPTAADVTMADFVVLAVKPQVLPQALEQVNAAPWAADALYLSIAAGVATARLEAQLPDGAHVVRAMPNTPLLARCGAATLAPGAACTPAELDFCTQLFEGIGRAWVVREDQIDATTAIHGSGPAYVAALVEALAAEGAAAGLPAKLAEELATQTVRGTGALMQQTGKGAAATRADVCSPGGTTLAALEAMDARGYSESIRAGVRAAIARARELGA